MATNVQRLDKTTNIPNTSWFIELVHTLASSDLTRSRSHACISISMQIFMTLVRLVYFIAKRHTLSILIDRTFYRVSLTPLWALFLDLLCTCSSERVWKKTHGYTNFLSTLLSTRTLYTSPLYWAMDVVPPAVWWRETTLPHLSSSTTEFHILFFLLNDYIVLIVSYSIYTSPPPK